MTDAPRAGGAMPAEFNTARLRRRALETIAILAVLGVVAVLAPGLDELRARLAEATPGWLGVAVVLEILSSLSYVAMFRPIFSHEMAWRHAGQLGLAEVGMGSLVPASGIGGLALGAWVLSRDGMDAEEIARRSVAFFIVKSSVNFAAVALLGLAMWLGLGRHEPFYLTIVPAVMAIVTLGLVVVLARLPAPEHGEDHVPAGRLRGLLHRVRSAASDGACAALHAVSSGDPVLLGGALGYWLFDNLVLWAAFHAFGEAPPLTIIFMGYLIGQLGGLLPIPGGIGGIDGGLLGTIVVYGAPAALTGAAVIAYRLVLFWIPLLLGAVAFVGLKRALADPDDDIIPHAPPPG